jgi:hypothetical protein
VTNPLLDKTKAQIMAKVDPRLQPIVGKIVNAGHVVMFSPKSRHLMQQQLQSGPNNPEVIGAGIAKLVAVLYAQSKKTAPINALIPAGMILLCDGLQFLEDSGSVKVSAAFLASCTQATGSAVLQVLGIQPEQVQSAIDQARAKMPGQPSGALAAPSIPSVVGNQSVQAGPTSATAPVSGVAPARRGVIASAMGA